MPSREGKPNKATARIKHNIVATFEQMGGLARLVKWAEANETEFYKLWAKLLPANVKHSGQLNHQHTHSAESVSDTAAWLNRTLGERPESKTPESLPH